MKATDVLVQCLENEGVEYIFGIVGSETLDFIDSLSRSNQIQYIPVRHEQGAAFMAYVYGKLLNKPGVCTATLGPGATNLLTGLACAFLDFAPVVAITGQTGLNQQHTQTHQYIELIKIMEPATKCAIQVKDATTIPVIVRNGFHIAMNEKPGPVFIELPKNIATQQAPPHTLPVTPLPVTQPSQQAIKHAATLIKQSMKPFVIVGNGVIRLDAVKELQDFIHKIQVPVVHSFMAKGILQKNDPYNFYTFGFEENDVALTGIEEADLLIVIGFDAVEKSPKDWNKAKLPVLHIHSVCAEVDEYYPVHGELIGHMKNSLNLLNTIEISPKKWVPSNNLKERIEQVNHIFHNEKDISHLPLTIENILHIIEKLANDQTLVISDVGDHKLSIARTYQPKQAGGVIISNGFASMGIAIPGAIGAKLALPSHSIICITGDGGALMNIQELETLNRLGIPLIIIVLNDSLLKLELKMMEKKLGNRYGVAFGNPDFVQLAESFGIRGMRPQTTEEFEIMLSAEMKSQREPVLIEIPLPAE